MIRWIFSLLFLALLLPGCSKEDPVFILPAQALQITPVQESIHLGSRQQYLAIMVDESGARTDVTGEVSWSSSDTAVATINAAGLTSSVAVGATAISAELNGARSETSLEVNNKTVTAIAVFPGERDSIVGLTTQYTATAVFSDDTIQDITADAAWSSDNPTVASVDAGGRATATDVGDATISARYAGVDGSALLHVLTAVPTSFEVKPATATVSTGTEQQYRAVIGLSSGEFIDVTREVSWVTSNASVAIASSDAGSEGIVLGVGDGSASVFAVISNANISLAADAEIIVDAAEVISLQVTPGDVSVPVGSYGKFRAVAGFDDGSYRDVTLESSWTSADTKVGVIVGSGPNAGLALAIGRGNTTVSASFGGVSATVNAAVSAATLNRLEVVPGGASTIEGLSAGFRVYGLYSDLSVRDVTTLADWSTGDATVAVMDPSRPGIAHALAQGDTTVVAQLDGISDSAALGVDARTITALAVFPANSRSVAGLTTQFTATALFNDNSVQDVTTGVNWSSDDTGVAAIDAGGLATATGAGDALITASLAGASATATLHVLGAVPVSFEVQPSISTIAAGTQRQYTATVGLSSGDFIDATDNVLWLTGDAKIATVANDPGSAGLVLGIAPGTTAVLAAVPVGGNKLVAEAEITVTGPAVTALQITPQNISVPVGASGALRAVAYFDDGSSRDVTRESTWSSSDPTVGVVVPDGVRAGTALAISEGSLGITARFRNVSDTAAIEVSGQTLVRLEVHPRTKSTPIGLTVSYSATGVYSDFSIRDLTQVVDWSTGDPTIAVMDTAQPGIAHGVGQGTVQVTAEFGGLADSAALTVTAATAVDIVIRERNLSIYNGASVDYRADVILSDGTVFAAGGPNTVWRSGDQNVATFTGNRADAVAAGATTVSVTYSDPAGSSPPLSDTTSLTVADVVIVDLNIEPLNASIAAGYQQAFKATARYNDGSSQDVSSQATWRSSNTGIATVDNQGVAHGEAAGTALIEAAFDGLAETAALQVSAAVLERLEVIPQDITLAQGEQRAFNAVAEYSDRIEEVTAFALWQTSDAAVATVSNAPGDRGVVSAGAAGPATITAFFDGLPAGAGVTVTAPSLVSIQVDCGDDISIDVGATGSCKAIGTYDNVDVSDITNTVDWVSTDTTVVTVWKDSNLPAASIYGVAVGTAEVTASEGLVSGSQTITVNDTLLISLTVISQNDTLLVNDTEQFYALGAYLDGSVRLVTQEVTWLSSNEGVLQISNVSGPPQGLEPGKGLATAIAAGNALVSATLDNVTAFRVMTVLPNTPAIDEFVMFCNKGPVEGPNEIRVGQKTRCEAHATVDGISENVTALANWSTDDPAIAAVDGIAGGSGKMDIVGVSEGTTDIRVEYEGFTAEMELIVR